MHISLKSVWMRLFFPARCIACRKVLPGDVYDVCPSCRPKLPFAPQACLSLPYTEACFAPFSYKGSVAAALHRLKFKSKPPYALPLARFMVECLPKDARFDFVTFVPISKKRKKERGFDQAEELARHVAALLYLPLATTLTKTTENKRQSSLPAAQRKGNVIGVYEASSDFCFRPGQRFLLIDDIITTGATLSEAAKTLRLAGVESVTGLAVAKTQQKH